MASVEPYVTESGRRYRARWRDLDRRSKERGGFRTKRDAERYLAKIEVDMGSGQYVDPSSAMITLGELGREWLANRPHLKPSSLHSLEIAWRIHVEPRWGERRIGTIRYTEVQAWVSELVGKEGQAKSATVVKRAHGVLAGILDSAVKDRRLTVNPARGISLPRKVKKSRAYLTIEQVEALARAAGEYGTLVHLLAYTGLRWGEAIGLRVRNVDPVRRRARIEQNAVQVGRVIEVGTPKGHQARSVPLPRFLVDELELDMHGRAPGALVFGDGTTHPFRPHSASGWFISAVRRCQKVDPTFPTLTLHDLRHTAASLAISSGAHVKAVQRMLGHASAAMTLDTYADLFDDDLDTVSASMESIRELRMKADAAATVGALWGLGPETSPETPEGPETPGLQLCARGDLNPHALTGTRT